MNERFNIFLSTQDYTTEYTPLKPPARLADIGQFHEGRRHFQNISVSG